MNNSRVQEHIKTLSELNKVVSLLVILMLHVFFIFYDWTKKKRLKRFDENVKRHSINKNKTLMIKMKYLSWPLK